MPLPKAPTVEITPRQRAILERLARRRGSRHQVVQRAQLLLHREAGLSNEQIARLMQLNRGTVRFWRARWRQAALRLTQAEAAITAEPENSESSGSSGSSGNTAPTWETEPSRVDKALTKLVEETLSDKPRAGAPATFTAEQVVQIMALACEDPAAAQRPVSHWTPRELADEAIQRGVVQRISARSVGRFLKAGGVATASRGVLAEGQARRSSAVCQPGDAGL